jgi:hypothetical protein
VSSRWAIVVGAVAIAAGIAWFALRGSDTVAPEPVKSPVAETPSAAGSGFIQKPRDGKAAIFAPEGPSLGSGSAAADTTTITPEKAFATEQRDARWAARTENEIKRRFRSLKGGTLDAAECKQDQCELTMSGSEEQMSQLLAEIETRRGLIGFANHVVLRGPEQKDGKLVIKAYAVFDRDLESD